MADVSYPLKFNPKTGELEYLTIKGQRVIRNTVPVQKTTTTTPAPATTDAVVSNPPAGYKKITNIYVDAEGKLIMEYTP
jgi:hypothetical protein